MWKQNKIIILLFAMCFCLFGGCQKAEEELATITVIHAWGSTESDHVAMRDIYESFQEENPDIRLQLISMPTRDELLRKVEDMIMVGNTPDVITFSGLGQNETYDFMEQNDMLIDFMPYLEQDKEFRDSISDVNLDFWGTQKNQLFTVADVLQLSGGYWYNEQVFAQAGIKEIPRTWEEFVQVCETLQTWSKKNNMPIKPLQISAEGYLYFMEYFMFDNNGLPKNVAANHDFDIKADDLKEPIQQLKKLYDYSTSDSPEYSYRDETNLFNEGKLAIYVNGVWAAPMISESIHAKYALLPTKSGTAMSCKSTCLGYVLGNNGNKEKELAAVRFVKYMLSEKVQTQILEETGQIPANQKISLSHYKNEKQRLYQGADLVLKADKKIEIPDNLWTARQKAKFTENILNVLSGELPEQILLEE